MRAPRWARLADRVRGLAWQLRGLSRPASLEAELDEEHRFHIDMEAERLEREGLPPAEARRRALVVFGGLERWQDEVRATRWTWAMEEAWGDVRLALRGLRSRPIFAAAAAGTLALGIGAATTLFSVVDAVLLRPFPVPEPDRLVAVELVAESGEPVRVVSLPDYLDYRDQAAASLDLAAQHLSDITLRDSGGARASLGLDVSANWLRVLGLAPSMGRFFGPEADRPGAPAEVVLSHELWRGRLGGDPEVLGKTLHVNGQPLTIIGVAPAGFHGTMAGVRPAVLLPLGLQGRLSGRDVSDRTGGEWLQPFGRLVSNETTEGAAAALALVGRRLSASWDYSEKVAPVDARVRAVSALPPRLREAGSRFAILLLGAALLLLTIAAVNVAGMLLARASSRGREMAFRMALGAGRGRLTRQLLAEGAVLGLLGGALGIALALLGTRLLEGAGPPGVAGVRFDFPVDLRVLGFGLAAAAASSLVFGLAPARHALRRDLQGLLRRGAEGRAGARSRGGLVAMQVAMTLVLLVATALLGRTLRNALAVDHGFQSEDLVLGELDLRLSRYDAERARVFHDRLLERLRSSPEVESAALSTAIPLGQGWDQTRASVPGLESPDPTGWVVGWSAVSEGYFETLRLPLRAGETPSTGARAPGIVINETLAERFWPGESPIGRGLRFSGMDATVAGVAPSGKYRSLSEGPTLFAWVPLASGAPLSFYVHVRPRTTPPAAAAELRRVVAGLDPMVPLINVTTLEAAMGQSMFLQRAAATLIGAFAGLGLLLAAAGIFGLLAYTVEQRRHEISVRMAVGGSSARIVRSVVGAGLRPVLVGVALGLAGALLASRLLEGLLYDVAAWDPWSFGLAAAALGAAALVAAWLPARRTVRMDPAAALRME